VATNLRYHNRINNLSDEERLIKCAFVEGMHDPAHLFWSHKVHSWLQGQPVGLSIEDDLDVSTVIGNAKNHYIIYAQTWHQSSLSSVARYQPLQPEYVLAPYLSTVKGFKSRILISSFRCGCHGLHVDTGRLLPLTQQVPREQVHCVFCASGLAEDEHHFVFDCPEYCAIRNRFTNMFWGPTPTLSSVFTLVDVTVVHDPKVIARFLRECFEHRNTLVAAQFGHTL